MMVKRHHIERTVFWAIISMIDRVQRGILRRLVAVPQVRAGN
jgi:hypothetical protein